MFNSSRPLDVLRSLVYLSLLGLAVTVLIGPVVAVAGTLLPFTLIGALVWGCYRGGRMALSRLRSGWTRPVVKVSDEAPCPTPVLFLRSSEKPTRPRRLRPLARTARYVIIEVGCGAALGAALCVLANWQGGPGVAHPALGAAIGAVVGFVVGGSRPLANSESAGDEAGTATQAA